MMAFESAATPSAPPPTPPDAVEESCGRGITEAALAGYVAFIVLSMMAAFAFVAATLAFAVREAVKERNRTRERIEREELIAMEELQRQRFLMDRNSSVLCPVTGEYLPMDGDDDAPYYSRLPSEEWSDVIFTSAKLPSDMSVCWIPPWRKPWRVKSLGSSPISERRKRNHAKNLL